MHQNRYPCESNSRTNSNLEHHTKKESQDNRRKPAISKTSNRNEEDFIKIDFEGKETDIQMFVHGLSPLTTTEELERLIGRRCLFKNLIHKKKKKIRNGPKLYHSVALFTVKDRKTARDLILRSEVMKGRIIHFDIKYEEDWKMETYKNRRLFLGNLKFNWDDKKIFEEISKYGIIRSAYSIKDYKTGRSKGYGYADFFSEEETERLLGLAPILIDGRKVGVKRYMHRAEKISLHTSSKHPHLQNERQRNRRSKKVHFPRHPTQRRDDSSGSFYHSERDSRRERITRNRASNYQKMGRRHNQAQFDVEELRKVNLRLIGLALRKENLFRIEPSEKIINKILIRARKMNKNSYDWSDLRWNKAVFTGSKFINPESVARGGNQDEILFGISQTRIQWKDRIPQEPSKEGFRTTGEVQEQVSYQMRMGDRASQVPFGSLYQEQSRNDERRF